MKRGLLARLFSRAEAPTLPPAAAPAADGPPAERWLLLAPREEAEARVREWAVGLRQAGCEVLLASDREHALDSAGVAVVPFATVAWRPLLGDPTKRLRVLVTVPDAASVAFAREAHTSGARVIYDKIPPERFRAVPRAFHPDDERALVVVADDRVAPDRATLRVLASLAGSGRIVHNFADAAEAGRAFPAMLEKPSVVVVLADDGPPEVTGATIDRLREARGFFAYRIAVVVGPEEGPALKALLAREEAGEILLLRDPRASLVSALAMGARATGSEVLVFLRTGQFPRDAEWLSTALAQLYRHAAIGALQIGESEPAAGVEPAVLPLPGLVLRRAAYRDAGGLEDTIASPAGAAIDFSLRLQHRGFRLEHAPDAALAGASGRPALPEADHKALRARWSGGSAPLRAALSSWKPG
jgi:hypothetical protein